METGLLVIMSITGLLALYWVLFGQWNYNKMMRNEKEKLKYHKPLPKILKNGGENKKT